MIYFTSDLHFMHDKDFLYGPRGYSSIEEHDEDVIKRWNEKVAEDDTIYILGDIFMGTDRDRAAELVKSLNGTLIIFVGNHDTERKLSALNTCPNVIISYQYASVFKHGKKRFYFSHYPSLTSNMDDDKCWDRVWNLHGHTHSKEKFSNGCCYNVALDAHDNYPVSIEEIIKDINNYWTNQIK